MKCLWGRAALLSGAGFFAALQNDTSKTKPNLKNKTKPKSEILSGSAEVRYVWAFSISWIFSRRPEWRPPENGVSSQICTMCMARFIEDARAEGEDVEIVVLARHLRFVGIADVGGADAGDLVGGNGHADA